MKVNFDNEQYIIGDDTLGFISSKLRSTIAEGYIEINEGLKFLLKTFSRKLLYDFEGRHGSTFLDYPLRPENGQDPNIHMIDLALHLLREGADNATITIKTEPENPLTGTRAITSITISNTD